MYTRKSLAEHVAKRQQEQFDNIDQIGFETIRQKERSKEVIAYQNMHYHEGLRDGYFLGLQDAGEIMAQRQLPWRTGAPKGKRILAQEKENFTGEEDFIEVLHLADNGDYYDIHGEVVPHGAIAKWLPL